MEFTPTQKRAAAWTAMAVLALLALRALGAVLTPFLIASVLAYALTPLVDRLDDAIFALLAFGQLLGFVGVLVALPASAVLLVAIRRMRSSYLASRLYHS